MYFLINHLFDSEQGVYGLMKKIIALGLCALVLSLSNVTTITASEQPEKEYIDSKFPDSQRTLVRKYSEQYGICEETLQALIFCESSYSMDAVNANTGCYGICQINPRVWGDWYTTEESQIQMCCEILTTHLNDIPDIGYALAAYNGQSDALVDYENGTSTEDEFVSKVLRISEQLEELHGKKNY